jgi:glycosyltransferase involved in cell wall biosynthesis
MKVAILCGYMLPRGYIAAGSTTYQVKLTRYLSHIKDIELHIITVNEENRQFKKDNLVIHTIKKGKHFSIPYFHPVLLWKIKHKIIEMDPDIVHAISTGFLFSDAAAFLRGKYPTVLTAYGIRAKEVRYYREGYNKFQKFLSYIFSSISIINERYVLTKIPNIIVQTPSIKNIISKWTKSKIHIVPSGIEYDKIEEIQSYTTLNLNESPDIFIVVNLEKIKGVDILIKAIPTVIKAIPNLNVYIAGTGPRENELKNLVKGLNLEAHVKFLGFISEEDKYQHYKACKIVVVPSRWDCQPFAPLDAAASGKPVVASRIGGIQDTVEDRKTGLLFEPENTDDLADKIVTLLKDERLREDMGKAAKVKAKEYDWSKIAERTLEIYKKVITDFHEQKAK